MLLSVRGHNKLDLFSLSKMSECVYACKCRALWQSAHNNMQQKHYKWRRRTQIFYAANFHAGNLNEIISFAAGMRTDRTSRCLQMWDQVNKKVAWCAHLLYIIDQSPNTLCKQASSAVDKNEISRQISQAGIKSCNISLWR